MTPVQVPAAASRLANYWLEDRLAINLFLYLSMEMVTTSSPSTSTTAILVVLKPLTS